MNEEEKLYQKLVHIIRIFGSLCIGILLLCFSVWYTLYVFYLGIDSISVVSFVVGLFFIFLGIYRLKYKDGYKWN